MGMVSMANIGTVSIIILFCISAFLWFGGYKSSLATMLIIDESTEQIEWGKVSTQIQTALAIAVAGAVAGYFAGSGVIAYALFSGIATFLFSFVFLPLSMMNEVGIPFPIKLVVGGVFSLTIMLALISWMKGGDL